MMPEWESQSWCKRDIEQDSFFVLLRLSAELEEVAWEWEDYPMSRVSYTYALNADGNATIVERRVEAINKEDDSSISWYGDTCNGDTAVFDRLAVSVIKKFADDNNIIEYRNEKIKEYLTYRVDMKKQSLLENQQDYADRLQELQEDQKEDMLDCQRSISEALAELAQFESSTELATERANDDKR